MVDFDKDRDANLAAIVRTGGSAQGGLTVRDYFAAKAMAALIEKYDESPIEVSLEAYDFADAMMAQREYFKSINSAMTVEEAFGLNK